MPIRREGHGTSVSERFLLNARFRPLLWLGMVFLATTTLTRLALLVATGSGVPATPANWAYAFAVVFMRVRAIVIERERHTAWVAGLVRQGRGA